MGSVWGSLSVFKECVRYFWHGICVLEGQRCNRSLEAEAEWVPLSLSFLRRENSCHNSKDNSKKMKLPEADANSWTFNWKYSGHSFGPRGHSGPELNRAWPWTISIPIFSGSAFRASILVVRMVSLFPLFFGKWLLENVTTFRYFL